MSRKAPKLVGAEQDEPEGLFLVGAVLGRSRRLVGENKAEVVSYRIVAGGRMHVVDCFEPKTYHAVGERIKVEVYPSAYRRKDGGVSISLRLATEAGQGEEF